MISRSLLLGIAALIILGVQPVSYAQETASDSPIPGLTIHVVQRGESLYRISLQYGASISDIADLNGITNTSSIQVGQRLLVPSPASNIPIEPVTHTVNPGETLGSISANYGVTIDRLIELNEIPNSNQIYTGQLLVIIPGSEPTETASGLETLANDAARTEIIAELRPEAEAPIVLHTVVPGETLFRIAQRYGLTVNELSNANSISDPTRIFVGQQLVIPGIEAADPVVDLPAPLQSLSVRPLIFVEGETGSIQIRTEVPATITGSFLGQTLNVIPLEAYTLHAILIGIPMFTESGIYPFNLNIVTADGIVLSYTLNMRISAGQYGSQNIDIDESRTSLLDPAVEEYEIGLLRDLTSRFNPERYFSGTLSLPAAAAMNSPFGTRRSYNGGPISRYHNGADFASAPGTPIYAAAPGRVVLADLLNIRGNAVVIDHGWGVYTTYSHQTTINVAPGDVVTTGQIIGTAGSTGRITGPHLHWEVWVNGVAVNPMQWVSQTFP